MSVWVWGGWSEQGAGRLADPVALGSDADREAFFEVGARVDAERDQRLGSRDALDLREVQRDDIGEVLVVLDADVRDKVDAAGDREDLGDARDVRDLLPDRRDLAAGGVDEHDG